MRIGEIVANMRGIDASEENVRNGGTAVIDANGAATENGASGDKLMRSVAHMCEGRLYRLSL